MPATPGQIAWLRHMTAEPESTSPYTDAELAAVLERHPIEGWANQYDHHAAAADVWEAKAAGVAAAFDYSADGGTFERSQIAAHYAERARWHAARRHPRTVTLQRGGTTDAQVSPE